jgi:hypothetical protein
MLFGSTLPPATAISVPLRFAWLIAALPLFLWILTFRLLLSSPLLSFAPPPPPPPCKALESYKYSNSPCHCLMPSTRKVFLSTNIFHPIFCSRQCCGSGSGLILVGRIHIALGWGSGTRRKRKKVKKCIYCILGYPLLRAEGFSCDLEVIHGGLNLDQNYLNFLSIFVHQISGSRSELTNNAGSWSNQGFALTPCGSTTLVQTMIHFAHYSAIGKSLYCSYGL